MNKHWHKLHYFKDHLFESEQHLIDTTYPPTATHLVPLDPNEKLGPNNYAWSDKPHRHQKNNRLITHNGEEKTLVEWCEQLNLDYNNVQVRLTRTTNTNLAFRPTIKPFTATNRYKNKVRLVFPTK